MKNSAKRALLSSVAVGLALGVAACRDDEQGRPMVKEKGVYEGPADEALPEDRVQDLKSRASGHKF